MELFKQQLFIFLCILTSIEHSRAEAGCQGQDQCNPICIVGAGLSGLNIGRLLQERGYKYIIFEQSSRLGGKVDTYRRNGLQVEMCPLLYTSASTHIVDLIDRFGLTSVPFNISDQSTFNVGNGECRDKKLRTESQESDILDAVKRYNGYHNEYQQGGSFDTCYLNASAELFVPMAEWLKIRDLQALTPIFTMAITVEGYGALDHIPALYVLRFVHPRILLALVGDKKEGFYSLDEGLDVLVKAMADSLSNNPVYLGYNVTRIYRGDSRQTVYLRERSSGRTYGQYCSKVIFAFPPLLNYLSPMLPDLENFEREILDQISIHKYTTAVHRIPVFKRTLYANGAFSNPGSTDVGDGQVVTFVKQNLKNSDDIYTSYSWIRGDFKTPATRDDSYKIWNKLQNALGKISKNAKTYNFKYDAQYFPHVCTESLQQGFYKKFDTLQGYRGTYYATTLLRFETMDSAIGMTEDFVAKHF